MKLLCIALEKSANIHLQEIIKELKDFEIYGIFDKNSESEKIHCYCDFTEFNTMGFVQVISLYRKAKRAINDLVQLCVLKNIDAVLLIDSPAFNIPFAKALRKANFKGKIIYFILPQVWAWKEGRIKIINALCDELIGILPFEREYFKSSHYFGNPSYETLKDYFKNDVETKKMIAFLPGSRKSEIKALMPIFRELRKKFLDYECVVCVPDFLSDKLFWYEDLDGFKISFDVKQTLKNCEFAYVCSGTASLQAGLIGGAFCLCYKAKMIDYLIAKLLVKIKYIGLCNIIFDKFKFGNFHDEFVQKIEINELFDSFKNRDKDEFLKKSLILRSITKGEVAKNVSKLIKEQICK